MSLIYSLSELPSELTASVVSIGNFDGVHLGHQSVIEQLKQKAQASNLPVVVITFDPLAREYFSAKFTPEKKDQLPRRLSSVEQRAELLKSHGVDYVCCLAFDEALEMQSAEDFVQTVLIDSLKVQHLVIGDDFHFGFQRQGDFAMLKQIGSEKDFTVESMQTHTFDDERVSSGRVRNALDKADFALAESLLGRPYGISGVVQKGQQLGSKIGFPTANIGMSGFVNSRLPLQGVFAVEAQLQNSPKRLQGVANIGSRPTVDGASQSLEAHLFNLSDHIALDSARQSADTEASYDLYGLELEVFFMHKLRDEMKFASIDDLQKQIAVDVTNAKTFFSNI